MKSRVTKNDNNHDANARQSMQRRALKNAYGGKTKNNHNVNSSKLDLFNFTDRMNNHGGIKTDIHDRITDTDITLGNSGNIRNQI